MQQTVGKESMNAIKKKKKTTCFLKKSELSNFKKSMPLRLFEFQEQFMIGTISMKLTKFEKTVSISNFFYFVGKS